MKKIIVVLITIISVITFIAIYNTESIKSYNEIVNFEENIEYRYNIVLPSGISSLNQETEVMSHIIEALNKSDGNIFYARENSNEDYFKYLYITDEECFSHLKLQDGDFLNKKDMESTKYLNTINEYNDEKVGTIASLVSKPNIQISTLKRMVKDGYTLGGNCIVTFKDSNGINIFSEEIKKSFNLGNVQVMEYNEPFEDGFNISINDIIVVGSLFLITMLLILYDLLKSYKAIGVEKLLGVSNKNIWFVKIKKLLMCQGIISIITMFLMSLYMFQSLNSSVYKFLGRIFSIYVFEAIIIFIVCSIPFLYLHKIKVSDIIKNKQNSNNIILLNFIVKVVLITILILSVNLSLNNFNRAKNVMTNSYENWEKLSDYYVIPYVYNIPIEFFSSKEFSDISIEVYKEFNKNGAIVASFSEYIEGIQNIRASEVTYEFEKNNIFINPNYLNVFPIYDTDGQPISVSEETENLVYLVPEKFKNQESEILNRYKMEMEIVLNPKTATLPIKIIWIKDNQKVFSAIMEVNPNDGNMALNPVARVITEKNYLKCDLDFIGQQYSPLKIKVEKGESVDSYIKPRLVEQDLYEYTPLIVGADEDVASEIKNIKENMIYIIGGIILVLVTIVILIIQNIYNFFNQYKQRIAIREFNGYKFQNKYEEYFIILLFNWLCIIISSLATRLISFDRLIYISLIGITVEMLFSIVFLILVGRRKTINIIKGGQ